jgi:hypothetical protein
MPLPVFGNVNKQADQRDRQLFSADVANRGEVFRVGGADDGIETVECGVNACDGGFGRLIVIVLAAERRKLIVGKLAAFGVGAEAVRAAGKMLQMESAGPHFNCPAGVFADLLARAEQVAANGVELFEDAAEPGLRLFRHSLTC